MVKGNGRHSVSINIMVIIRLGYADFLLSSMANILPQSVNLLYDIGCKLVAHWKVNLFWGS